MASHFDCIGFAIETEEQFGSTMLPLANSAEPVGEKKGTRFLEWNDGSGARICFVVDREGIECVTPSLEARSMCTVRALEFVDGEGDCKYCRTMMCEMVDPEGIAAYPLAISVEKSGLIQSRIRRGSIIRLSLVMFAESVRVFADARAYEAAESALAKRSVIPSGLFLPGGEKPTKPSAHVIMSGEVVQWSEATNRETTKSFVRALVDTYAAQVEVVGTPDELAGVREGSVLQGTFWCVGSVDDETLEPRKRGLLSRLRA